jgi:hypothetical protein
MVFSKSDPRRSVGLGATCSGYQFFAISGLAANPHFNSKHICVMDHTRDQVLYDASFPQSVLAIRVSPQMVFLAFYDHVEIVNFQKGACVDRLSASPNVYAPLDMSADFRCLAMQGPDAASISFVQIHVVGRSDRKGGGDLVAIIRFNRTGEFVAVGCVDGKVVRVFETESGRCIGQFKRGNIAAGIHALDFSPDTTFLAVLSQSGTIHFFDLRNMQQSSRPPTTRASQKLAIGTTSFARINWADLGFIVVVTADGFMLNISIDETDCHEVGREQVPFVVKIAEETHTPI